MCKSTLEILLKKFVNTFSIDLLITFFDVSTVNVSYPTAKVLFFQSRHWSELPICLVSFRFCPTNPGGWTYIKALSCCCGPEVGKVTLKSNGDEALSDDILLKSNGDEAFNAQKNCSDEAMKRLTLLEN
jgi:hypothetical protein